MIRTLFKKRKKKYYEKENQMTKKKKNYYKNINPFQIYNNRLYTYIIYCFVSTFW